ncbi:hypothetical protein [uncultured Pseudomonas sp.]|uniref:hypothetical protein n=1 Tax=uncultured Pseudomonas sp. TaxID=114707 RepID=UPI00258DFA2D|nr:hypothetical protein [uncultured Pseudomonas sp.]
MGADQAALAKNPFILHSLAIPLHQLPVEDLDGTMHAVFTGRQDHSRLAVAQKSIDEPPTDQLPLKLITHHLGLNIVHSGYPCSHPAITAEIV